MTLACLTTKKQIGVRNLMAVGAHKFRHDNGGNDLIFNAKILPFNLNGERGGKARTMQVAVRLTPQDTYDIEVTFVRKQGGAYQNVVHFETEGVYADQLGGLILALDWDGPTALNPRYV